MIAIASALQNPQDSAGIAADLPSDPDLVVICNQLPGLMGKVFNYFKYKYTTIWSSSLDGDQRSWHYVDCEADRCAIALSPFKQDGKTTNVISFDF